MILRDRARRLAEPPPAPDTGKTVDLLLFRLGAEEYAIELKLLRGVRLARGLTPVPGTPAHVAGILNVRGEILTVIDLAAAVGLASAPASGDSAPVILVDHPAGRVGLLVSEVAEVRRVDLGTLHRGPSSRDYVRGVIEARQVVIDLEQLLGAGAFEVDEEVR